MSARSVARARSACSWRSSLHSRSPHGAAISTTPARTAREASPMSQMAASERPRVVRMTSPVRARRLPKASRAALNLPVPDDPPSHLPRWASSSWDHAMTAPTATTSNGIRKPSRRSRPAFCATTTSPARSSTPPTSSTRVADRCWSSLAPPTAAAASVTLRPGPSGRAGSTGTRPLLPSITPCTDWGRQRPEEEVGHEAGPWQGEQDEDQPDEPHLPARGARASPAHTPPMIRPSTGRWRVRTARWSPAGAVGARVGPLVRSRHAHIFAHVRPGNERIQGRSALPQGPVRVDPHGEGRLPKEAWLP